RGWRLVGANERLRECPIGRRWVTPDVVGQPGDGRGLLVLLCDRQGGGGGRRPLEVVAVSGHERRRDERVHEQDEDEEDRDEREQVQQKVAGVCGNGPPGVERQRARVRGEEV